MIMWLYDDEQGIAARKRKRAKAKPTMADESTAAQSISDDSAQLFQPFPNGYQNE
jgi:hypothetical protein